MVNLTGKTLGKYQLIEELGSGGFATIYKAYQPHLDRYVALKVLHPHLVAGKEFLSRFSREAKAVASLRHPNIVIVHDFEVEDNTYYMVMEYVDGQSLQEILEKLNDKDSYMPLMEVGRIMAGVADALDYAHSQGMLHRDIKPSNVLLNAKGEPFLTDFGITRILSQTQFTATGVLIGTPTHMSPEQGQGKKLTPASDVYSLGVILYEMLTGHVPFDADTPLAIIFKHVSDPLPPIHSHRPDLPADLEGVIYKSLAKEPGDRFQSPKEMNQALQGVLSGVKKMETVLLAKDPAADPPKTVKVIQEETEPVPEFKVEPPKPEVVKQVESPAATIKLKDDPGDRRWYQSTLFKVISALLGGVVILGVLLFTVILPWIDNLSSEVPDPAPARPAAKSQAEDRPVMEEDPGLVHFERGVGLLNEEKRYRAAIEEFNQAESLGFIEADLYHYRGWACHEEKIYHDGCDFYLAIEDYNRAIDIEPTIAEYYMNRAWSFVHIERWDEALADYSTAIELEPGNPVNWVNRADVYSRTGDYRKALGDVNHAIEMEPGVAYFYKVRADIVWKSGGDIGLVEKDLFKALELNPGLWEAHIALGELYTYEIGDPDLGINHFNQAVSLAPQEAVEPNFARGLFFVHVEAWEEAIPDLTRGIELQPHIPDGYGHRGNAFAHRGMFDEARADFERFLELSRGNPDYDGWREEVEGWLQENR